MYIASGLTAVIMATAPIFNAFHGRLIYGIKTNNNFSIAVFIGLTDIICLFSTDLLQTDWSKNTLLGLLYALAGTWCFSIGNMISMRNSKSNIKPLTATSYAMI